jgi:hypothetical protein
MLYSLGSKNIIIINNKELLRFLPTPLYCSKLKINTRIELSACKYPSRHQR